VVVCDGCPTGPGQPGSAAVIDALRGVVRGCPHGMLVTVSCLLGPVLCSGRTGPGVVAAVQPCTADRKPIGRAHFVGPMDDPADPGRLRAWVHGGRWESRPFDNQSN
jgi:hypothetical protein